MPEAGLRGLLLVSLGAACLLDVTERRMGPVPPESSALSRPRVVMPQIGASTSGGRRNRREDRSIPAWCLRA